MLPVLLMRSNNKMRRIEATVQGEEGIEGWAGSGKSTCGLGWHNGALSDVWLRTETSTSLRVFGNFTVWLYERRVRFLRSICSRQTRIATHVQKV